LIGESARDVGAQKSGGACDESFHSTLSIQHVGHIVKRHMEPRKTRSLGRLHLSFLDYLLA
jgi:hypothetical protein